MSRAHHDDDDLASRDDTVKGRHQVSAVPGDSGADLSASEQTSLASGFSWQYPTLWRQGAAAPSGLASGTSASTAAAGAGDASLDGQRDDDGGVRGATASTPKAAHRKRGVIPFELATLRTPPTSPSLVDQASPAAETVSPSTQRTASNAYGTLSRVKDRDRVASSMRLASATSMQTAVNSPGPQSHREQDSDSIESSEPSGSWLAWGTMKLRDTVSKGVPSSIWSGVSSEQNDDDLNSSVSTSSTQSWLSVLQGPKSPSAAIEMSEEELERFVNEIVKHCGKDRDGRNIISLAAPCLPPADVVSHDALLQRILIRIRPYVTQYTGYTLILYSSGAEHTKGDVGFRTPWPGWTWCWRVYRSLDRSYRKNLKKLIIVHPTMFTRSLVRFVSSGSYFISPKFARKIVECRDLQALAEHVLLAQLTIPSRVLIWDLRLTEREPDLPIARLRSANDQARVFNDAVDAILGRKGRKSLTQTEGLFRVSPSSSLLAAVKYAYCIQPHVDLAPYVERDRHLPAALLKAFLRSMNPPLVTSAQYPLIRQCPTRSTDAVLSYVKTDFLTALGPAVRQDVFVRLVRCLAAIHAHRQLNRMDASNLAIVVAPSLVHSDDLGSDIAICAVPSSTADGDLALILHAIKTPTLGIILQICIEHCDELFGSEPQSPRDESDPGNSERPDVRDIFPDDSKAQDGPSTPTRT